MNADLPQAVLFACTMNAIRSPMAAGILHYLHPASVFVDSAGVRPADDVNGFAVAVMEELGIDITEHRPKAFSDLEDANFDLIISLSPEAQHTAVDMTRDWACDVEFWHTFDPSVLDGSREVMMDAYRQVRDTLFERISNRFPAARHWADL